MIRCIRVASLSHTRRGHLPLFFSPTRAWIACFASKTNPRDPSSNPDASSGSGAPPIQEEPHIYQGFDPPPAAQIDDVPSEPADAGSIVDIEPWTTVQDLLSGGMAPLMSDAGNMVLMGAYHAGANTLGGIQEGIQLVHATTGLPWWATIVVTTVCVKTSLLPVVVLQQKHMERLRQAWPEIQTLRKHLNDTLDQTPKWRVLDRCMKYKIFFSGTRGLMGMHGAHPLGLLATPLVNLPVFIMFVWSIRAMLRDATVPGLDTGGMLWFVDLTVSDSSLMLPVISTACTYTGLELAKMKGATGWVKWFQDGMQTFMILFLSWSSTFPQGVFMYWIPSSIFQSCQTLAIKRDGVRILLGLQPLGKPPAAAAPRGVAGPPPKQPPAALTAGDSTVSTVNKGGTSASGFESGRAVGSS